jgi:hypothetical protein
VCCIDPAVSVTEFLPVSGHVSVTVGFTFTVIIGFI